MLNREVQSLLCHLAYASLALNLVSISPSYEWALKGNRGLLHKSNLLPAVLNDS